MGSLITNIIKYKNRCDDILGMHFNFFHNPSDQEVNFPVAISSPQPGAIFGVTLYLLTDV